MAQALKPLYRVTAWCPTCDKTCTITNVHLIPNPRIPCHWCMRDLKRPVEMKIVAAEQQDERTWP